MNAAAVGAAAPSPSHALGTSRLLAGVGDGPVDLRRHRALHAAVAPWDRDALAAAARTVGLLGRGGAAFPVATKLASVVTGAETRVVVNGAEGEPASGKDRVLMSHAPHLVLDGALLVAGALGTRHVSVAVEDARAATALVVARDERDDAAHVEILASGGGFVGGEVRALLAGLGGAPSRPPGRRVLPHVRGLDGAPTFASNVETFAQLAVLAGLGPDAFAAVGAAREPGTILLTLVGDVPRPGVVEVPTGLALDALVGTGPVLVGGYHGTWVADPRGLVVSRPDLRDAGVGLGAGVLARLPEDTCPLGEVQRVTRWLAEQSAGQCGPCVLGLPAVAEDLALLLQGEDVRERLRRRAAAVVGRGACAHPDAAARLVGSALAVWTQEVQEHLAHGSCGRPVRGALPVGGAR